MAAAPGVRLWDRSSRDRAGRALRLGTGGLVLVGRLLPAARADVVALDHLVQRRRLDVQQLRGALLDAARGLERRLDQALLEVAGDFLERDALRREDERRKLEPPRRADVVQDEVDPDARARAQHDG